MSEIDIYIVNQPKATQKSLEELRGYIHEAVPTVKELINYNIPAFTLLMVEKEMSKL